MKSALLVFLGILLIPVHLEAQGYAPLPPVGGIVFSQRTGPLPGVTVSLVHPVVGRSNPSVSNMQGVYYFSNVPPQPQPYYIEAYWGTTLIYRNLVSYQGGSVRVDIPLP